MKISPIYSVSQFIEANEEQDWEKLVEIFKDRINGRYLKPIELISSDCENSEFSGFSIMSLDCILIETLNQFYLGKNNTDDKPCENSAIKNAFTNFLTTSEYFKDSFNKTTAEIFYTHFRNGLLHQAQTKKNSLIKIEQNSMVSKVDDSLIIDRIKFHQAIKEEFNSYIEKLLKGNDDVLRKNFIQKMKYICNIP